MKKKLTQKKERGHTWNLAALYQSPSDPQMEKDIRSLERATASFAQKYEADTSWTSDTAKLLAALKAFERILDLDTGKPIMYLYFSRDTDASNTEVAAKIALVEDRFAKNANRLEFFRIALGSIAPALQEKLLSDKRFSHFKVWIGRVFDDAKHTLSVPEEKIMNLKSIPAYNMWVAGSQRELNSKLVEWKGKKIPLAQALGQVHELKTAAERAAISAAIARPLKEMALFAEAEINAVLTNKKINDELRGYSAPYENTVLNYRNDPKVVDTLVETVTKAFPIAHKFYTLKAKLLGLKDLSYADRMAKIGNVRAQFDFSSTQKTLTEIFRSIGPRYEEIFSSFLKDGRIDVYPRPGKKSGAYCWGAYKVPTHVMLNHTDDLGSFTTAAHEMGHAFHTELSKSQGILYHDYSTSLAETASTLFESIAEEHVLGKLSDAEKVIMLHDKINGDISTIFRQIACFNYEKSLHEEVRAKGFISHSRIAELHNEHMGAYLGPKFKIHPDDGYYFVHWGHIRRFFYVYSYAYGQLVSKAMLRRYKADPAYWTQIERFLSAGGKDTPENILKEIGIDVSTPEFWQEGLKEIERDIERLESLARPMLKK